MYIETSEPTNQNLFDIFITAIEGGGSGTDSYSIIEEYHWESEDGTDDVDGFYAIVRNQEDDAFWTTFRIDANIIKSGIVRIAQGKAGEVLPAAREVAIACLTGQDPMETGCDTIDCDQVVQAGMFGRVLYG